MLQDRDPKMHREIFKLVNSRSRASHKRTREEMAAASAQKDEEDEEARRDTAASKAARETTDGLSG